MSFYHHYHQHCWVFACFFLTFYWISFSGSKILIIWMSNCHCSCLSISPNFLLVIIIDCLINWQDDRRKNERNRNNYLMRNKIKMSSKSSKQKTNRKLTNSIIHWYQHGSLFLIIVRIELSPIVKMMTKWQSNRKLMQYWSLEMEPRTMKKMKSNRKNMLNILLP